MVKDVTLTLNGLVQQLSDALAAVSGVSADALAAKNVTCQQIQLQADGANSNAIFVGGSASLTTGLYGVRIPVPVTNIPAAPTILSADAVANLHPSDVYVLGTNAEKLHALLVLA